MFCFELLKFMLDILNSGGVPSFAERRLSELYAEGGFGVVVIITHSK